MRYLYNDKFIKGPMSFEQLSQTSAMFSYFYTLGGITIPIGTVYNIEDKDWTVTGTAKSLYNSNVMNVYLRGL